jgi:septum formation protein
LFEVKTKEYNLIALVLASASPRRSQLLRQLNLSFDVITPDIDETPLIEEQAFDYVGRMAEGKIAAATEWLLVNMPINGQQDTDIVVLCADTIVVLDGEILGKPKDEEDAVGMLLRMSGRRHLVATAVTVRRLADGFQESFRVETEVTFRHISELECRKYWLTGEPADKAGAYGIQGLGAIFVESITGSCSNVAGLPLRETAECLARFGIDCLVETH